MPATASTAPRRYPRNPLANYGIQIEPIPGINLTNSLMNVSLDCDKRYHNLTWECIAVNYTGGAGLAIVKVVSASGAGGTATLAVNGFQVPTTIGTFSGGTGWAVNDTFTVTDATGKGAVFTVNTVSSGAITAATYVANSATATPIDPRLLISNIQLIVGTTAVVESTAAMEIFRADVNENYLTRRSLGQLPIYFTEPWRRTTDGRVTSWDMAGQNVFSIKFTMVPGYVNVGIAGAMVFDYIRNTAAGEIDQVTYQGYVNSGNFPAPQLRIIARKLLTPTLNGGDTLIQPALIPTGWPILRLHMFPATVGTITKILMKADTQIVAQGQVGNTVNGSVMDQLIEFNKQWGFATALSTTAPSINPDWSYIADYDQRIANALKVSSLQLTVTSTQAEGLTILQEYLETSYS
jgi:hypothetical protein